MINYDTIKSVYDDKLTLMQWLKKVEEALKDATAVSFNVNKTGDATLTFSIVFDDGTELETDPIILEQGESVESATLRNGHLILTLTNGDELDAGDMGAVSSFSIDANQHLIVTYQDGSTDDLGAIFSGNINISGNLTASGNIIAESVNTKALNDITAQGYIDVLKPLKVSNLKSDNVAIITEKPILENMTDYSFIPASSTSEYDIEYVYVGAAKNGNKLTFVLAFYFTRLDTITSGAIDMGKFLVPNDILNKLYPTLIGSVSWLDLKKITGWNQVWSSIDDVVIGSLKEDMTAPYGVYANMRTEVLNTATLNTKYYLRYEVTLLLGENLAE